MSDMALGAEQGRLHTGQTRRLARRAREGSRMTAVDISELIAASLEDRARCRLAGIAAPDANTEVTTHLLALAERLKDRHGAVAAMRAAFVFWDSLEAEATDTTH